MAYINGKDSAIRVRGAANAKIWSTSAGLKKDEVDNYSFF